MSALLALARPELRDLVAYQPARYEADCIRLNANEAPWRAPNDHSRRGLNTYPPPRPFELRDRLAKYYGVESDQLLVTRGSSEGIDLLIRAFCVGGRDAILICPPTFGMYQVYAAIQGASVRRVPLRREEGFALDEPALMAAMDAPPKLVFLCSPNNPTGNEIDHAVVARVCQSMTGHGLVVIDEAYFDFIEGQSMLSLRQQYPHVVILRTLSKAHGLAGARCGALIADPDVIDLLSRILPPYGLPTPSIEAALASLEGDTMTLMGKRIEALREQRARMAVALAKVPGVLRVYPSAANFLLIEAADPGALVAAARRHGVLIRDYSNDTDLPGALRISIGTEQQNDLLLAALATEAPAHD